MGQSPGGTASRTTEVLAVPLLSLQPGEICLSLLQKPKRWWKQTAVSARILFEPESHLPAPADLHNTHLQCLGISDGHSNGIQAVLKFMFTTLHIN